MSFGWDKWIDAAFKMFRNGHCLFDTCRAKTKHLKNAAILSANNINSPQSDITFCLVSPMVICHYIISSHFFCFPTIFRIPSINSFESYQLRAVSLFAVFLVFKSNFICFLFDWHFLSHRLVLRTHVFLHYITQLLRCIGMNLIQVYVFH